MPENKKLKLFRIKLNDKAKRNGYDNKQRTAAALPQQI
jgi:hypothetical protein